MKKLFILSALIIIVGCKKKTDVQPVTTALKIYHRVYLYTNNPSANGGSMGHYMQFGNPQWTTIYGYCKKTSQIPSNLFQSQLDTMVAHHEAMLLDTNISSLKIFYNIIGVSTGFDSVTIHPTEQNQFIQVY